MQFIFNRYFQTIDIWSTYPRKLSCVSEYQTHPLRIGGAKIGKKLMGLRLVHEFSTKITVNVSTNVWRVSRSKISFCELG